MRQEIISQLTNERVAVLETQALFKTGDCITMKANGEVYEKYQVVRINAQVIVRSIQLDDPPKTE